VPVSTTSFSSGARLIDSYAQSSLKAADIQRWCLNAQRRFQSSLVKRHFGSGGFQTESTPQYKWTILKISGRGELEGSREDSKFSCFCREGAWIGEKPVTL
jgi:hypothetical protein